MERGVVHFHGGTLSLLELTREHTEAIEYDLIGLGLRLRDCPSPAFNWRDLWVVARRLGRDSQLYQEMNPDDDPSWNVKEYLLAQAVDALTMRLWQAGGGKGRKPKPVVRPGDVKKYRGDSLPMDAMRDWLGWDTVEDAAGVDLSPEDRARQIKLALTAGDARKAIAERFDVSLSTVGRIARGDAWAHI